MHPIETTVDIVLRRTSRKWIGIVQIDGREVYRTWDYHDVKESALERCDKWFADTLKGGDLAELAEKVGVVK